MDLGTTEALMDLFGPWLPWLFGVGAVLLASPPTVMVKRRRDGGEEGLATVEQAS